jgi:SCP-2 sterol transfer family
VSDRRPSPDGATEETLAGDEGGTGRLRFLSPQWFDQVAASRADGSGSAARPAPSLVVEQVVVGTPYGEVRYRVEVGDGAVVLLGPGTGSDHPAGTAVVTITSDWDSACSLAAGELSAERALLEGRLKVRGDVAAISGVVRGAGGLDALPSDVRARTAFR